MHEQLYRYWKFTNKNTYKIFCFKNKFDRKEILTKKILVKKKIWSKTVLVKEFLVKKFLVQKFSGKKNLVKKNGRSKKFSSTSMTRNLRSTFNATLTTTLKSRKTTTKQNNLKTIGLWTHRNYPSLIQNGLKLFKWYKMWQRVSKLF